LEVVDILGKLQSLSTPIVCLHFAVLALADEIPIFRKLSASFQVIDFWYVPKST